MIRTSTLTALAAAALCLSATLPLHAAGKSETAGKTVNVKAQKIDLSAESGKTHKVEATLVQDGKKFKLTADEIKVKLEADGALSVEAVNGVMEEILAPAVSGPVKVEGGWRFTISDEAAKTALGKAPSTVSLAGDFNNWSTNDPAYALKNQGGVWSVVVPMPSGKHEYKFVLDGGTKWKEDPSNSESSDDHNGGVNSVLTVP